MKKIFVLLFFVTINVCFAYRCYDSYCDDLRFGAGMYYSDFENGTNGDFSSQNAPNYSSVGGLLSIYVARYWDNRAYFGMDLYAGIGSSVAKGGFVDVNQTSQNLNFFYNVAFHLGANLNTKQNPFFLSLDLPSLEWHDFYGGKNERLRAIPVYVGVSVLGRYAISNDLDIEYALGYAHEIATRFASAYFNELSYHNGFKIESSLGVIMRRDIEVLGGGRKKPDFYAKLRGSYHNFSPLKLGNATYNLMDKGFMIGIEVGIGLDWSY